MSEERLNEIKDSVNFQKELLLAHNMNTLCVDEEQELIEEIDRLNNIIETYKNANEYHQNKIEELEKLLRKTPSQLISENVDLRAKNNRLNNIINELEKWLETKREKYANNIEWLSTTRMSNVLDKIKELKESDKE